jgi:hypothetical protein
VAEVRPWRRRVQPARTRKPCEGIRGQLSGLMNSMQAADVAPTANILAAVNGARASAARVMAKWNALRTIELPALNARLKAAGLSEIE